MRKGIFSVLLGLLIGCSSHPNCTALTASSSAPEGAPVAPVSSSAVVVTNPDPPPPPLQVLVSRHILVVGDSEACAVTMWINLPDLVHKINDENNQPLDKVDARCKGGSVVQYWGAGGHLKQALGEFPKPDTVVVFLGGNHYWQGFAPPTETVTDLLKDTNCVWVGNAEIHHKKWPINQLIRDKVTPQCQYFDTEAASIPLADGAHPTPEGATKWIRLVWPLIPLKYENRP